MKKLIPAFFSMLTSTCLLVVLMITIAYATFIENDYGTGTAKILIYNSWWFNALFILSAINLIGGIIYYKGFRKKRWSMVLFHLAFVVILIGAGITRFYSYEGIMHIREGETGNTIITTESYISVEASLEGKSYSDAWAAKFSPNVYNNFSHSMNAEDENLKIELVNYMPNAVESIIPDASGIPLVSFIIMNRNSSRRNLVLAGGENLKVVDLHISFEGRQDAPGLAIQKFGDGIRFSVDDTVTVAAMNGRKEGTAMPGETMDAKAGKVYRFGDYILAFKSYYPSGKKVLSHAEGPAAASAPNALKLNVRSGKISKEIIVFENEDGKSNPASVMVNEIELKITYGPKLLELPFAIQLNDFTLERYAGSKSPSSYSSNIVLLDSVNEVEMPYNIYMNNVLDYGGYRFFQSSYDTDEKGTILSVSHDALGTKVTYLGYFLMSLGMIFTFFNRTSRFHFLLRKSSRLKEWKKQALGILIFGFINLLPANGANSKAETFQINPAHLAKFQTLLVQDRQGRIEPVQTLASEALRKLTRKNGFMGMNPTEVFLRMSVDPEKWKDVPVVKVSNGELRESLGISGNYASFTDLAYSTIIAGKLRALVEESFQKPTVQRNKFDKEVINVDERMNICLQIFQGEFLRIFPEPGHPEGRWYSESDFYSRLHTKTDSVRMLSAYFKSLSGAMETNDFALADKRLQAIKKFQYKNGKEIIPSKAKIHLEVLYNRLNIFNMLYKAGAVIGLVLLVIHLFHIFNDRFRLRKVISAGTIIILFLFLIYTAGLAARWYISGHAPWSNAYETLLYVGWATLLTGFVFIKKSSITLTVTTILASLILMVAGMSWMNPEITNLAPVLKSYWLIIHVAIITASYGFLGVAALLGFLTLIMMIFRAESNLKRVSFTIVELAVIIELCLIVGLILLTIGAFIGGVWANESWGRYWGWDPKESWALITIFVYAFIIHLRKVPGLDNPFVLSALSLIGFGSVIMTFFGVNYYLSGMHSYAQGDPPPIPSALYLAIGLALVSILLAGWSDLRHGNAESAVKLELEEGGSDKQ